MARISVNIVTDDIPLDNLKLGSWELIVKAGLNDNVDEVLEEASDRVKGAIQSLPPEKRAYPEHLNMRKEPN